MTATFRREGWIGLGAVLLLGLGTFRAASLAWVCDDAFISIRYAENLVDGLGLVYNAGERVEGYTNLLWTLMLAAAMKFGAPPVATAKLLGVLCYLALAGCLFQWSRVQARQDDRWPLPLAAGLVLVSADFHVWATGGLETMLFTALAVPALLLTRSRAADRSAALLSGGLLALLVLTRLDGVLLAGAAAVSWWLPMDARPREERARLSLLTLAPVVAVLAALLPWKLAYYGDIFPTAFYSKSVLDPYVSQGLVYLGLFIATNWILVAALALLALPLRENPVRTRWDNRFLLASAALYAAYVVSVGGDFMASRRLIPVAPLLFVVIESRLNRVLAPRARTSVAFAALLLAAIPFSIFQGYARIEGVADERRFYPAEMIEARRRQAETVGPALAGTGARVAFEGGMCAFGYYSRLPYLVEITGLTQYSLAKLPLEARGTVGHEKTANAEWLTQNDIHFVVSQAEPPIERPSGPRRFDAVYFGDVARARIHLYSDAVMDPLRERPDVDFVPIERVLQNSRRQLQAASPSEAAELYETLDRYYFQHAGVRGEKLGKEFRSLVERKNDNARDAIGLRERGEVAPNSP